MLREKLNNNQGVVTLVAAVAILLAGVYIFYQTTMANQPPDLTSRAFYSVDDGKTWFADDMYRVTPFTHNGKEAFSAMVVEASGKEPYVAYLIRFGGSSLTAARELEAKGRDAADYKPKFEALQAQALEIRKPGEKQWHKVDSASGRKLMETSMALPDGSTAEAVIPD